MSHIAVLLKIGSGTFAEGFSVTLQILEEGRTIKEDLDCPEIPAAPHMPSSYINWQQRYDALGQIRSFCKIQPIAGQITHESVLHTCQVETEKLQHEVQQWFREKTFSSLRKHILALLAEVKRQPEHVSSVVLSIRTGHDDDDILLRKLPWHLWNLLDTLRNAEIILSAGFNRSVVPLSSPIRILAIFGSSEGALSQNESTSSASGHRLELDRDQSSLQRLKQQGAEITMLEQPRRDELHQQLWNHPWDILFFGGHSSSQENCQNGSLQIQNNYVLQLDQLKADLRRAVTNGLKIAIFNSCDGLGLANYLAAELQLSTLIVMREPVPDVIARDFLKIFLQEFSHGKSLSLAVREARSQLHRWESDDQQPCPAASWLPVICQNPNQPDLVWPASPTPLSQPEPPVTPSIQRQRSPRWLLWAGLAAIAGLAAVTLSRILPAPEARIPPPSDPSTSASSLSFGEKQLLSDITPPEKQEGISAFAAGKYADAIAFFRQSLQANPNDPETWIYLNNAIAEQQAAAHISKGILQIAVSVPIELDPDVSAEQLRGVAIAQSQLNCGIATLSWAIQHPSTPLQCGGGIGRQLLKIQIADDRGDDKSVAPIAEALAAQSNIVAVIGHNSSSVAQVAVEEVYNKVGLVAVSPTSTSVKLSGLSRYLFRTSTNDAIAAQMLAQYAQQQGLSQVAIAYVPGDPYSESLREEFRQHLPNQRFVYDCDLSQGGVGFNAAACLKNAKAKGAEVLLLVPNTLMVDRALSLVNLNNGELRLLGGDTLYSPKIVTAFGTEASGGKLVVAVPWHRNNSSFEQDAQTLFSSLGINWRTAMAYDAAQAIITGLRRGSPTREGLRQALSQPGFSADGAVGQGTVRFDPSGDRIPESNIGVLVKVAEAGNGSYSFQLEQLK